MIIQCASTKADLTKTTVLDSLLKDLQQEEPGVWIKEAVSCFLRVVLQDSNYYASATLLNSYPSSSSRSVDREGGLAICT